MEKRKESLSVLKLCRFCLSQNQSLGSIYDKRLSPKNSAALPLKILSTLSIEIFPSDKMPSYICNYCNYFIDLFSKYKQIVRTADENILKYIQNGTALESATWPTSLLKAYQNSIRNEVVNTAEEDGTTVQVTHEVSDSEDEEGEKFYNLTIGDSDDESKSVSTIKVVRSNDGQDENQTGKGFSPFKKIVRHARPKDNDRPYICKHCGKTFCKSHHFSRHLRLKHGGNIRSSRGPFGQPDQYRCDQCDDSFPTQDELIYHSAIHATQNLICPLCQEKFPNVDEVTTHIKSHVNGVEFMCDFCELVFTTKDKLESHIIMVHEDEFHNESSVEMDAREDDEDNDNGLNVKDKGDHMLVEINKAEDYMLRNSQEEMADKFDNINSDDSEPEVTYTELSSVDTLTIIKKQNLTQQASVDNQPTNSAAESISCTIPVAASSDDQTLAVLKQVEEVKQKQAQQETEKKEKSTKSESNNSVGASNKSLQLLEKELQELKRTNNPKGEGTKTVKTNEQGRSRRPQVHASTPKTKSVEEKKTIPVMKTPVTEKKIQPERRIVAKENKDSKENKEKVNSTNTKEDKEVKDKDAQPTTKSVVKNGNNEKSVEEGIRRSTRPSKVKDYAKMIRDKPDDDESEDADDDEEYKEEKVPEKRGRKSLPKAQSKLIEITVAPTNQSKMGLSTPSTTPTPRKRGRPRKEPPKEVPAKMKKGDVIDETIDTAEADEKDADCKNSKSSENASDAVKPVKTDQVKPSAVLVTSSGQTLKKVPIKSLPPGVKPLPLPPSPGPELFDMQIGKKMVKVQKIVMTKAEVEAMAKKGLVEMKGGTMVLKQGIKLPNTNAVTVKSSRVTDKELVKESIIAKREKGLPSRCDLGDDS